VNPDPIGCVRAVLVIIALWLLVALVVIAVWHNVT